MQTDALDLTHGLLTEHAVEFTVVAGDLSQRHHLTGIQQLTDPRGIIHRLVLQGRQTIVEHGIGDVQVAVLQLCLADLVVEHLKTRLTLSFAQETVIEAVTIVEQIVGRYDGQQQQDEQYDGNRLVGLRLLHGPAIIAEGVVGRHLLEELGVYAVIIAIQLPLMECEGSDGTLVTDVEDDMIVRLHAVVEPLDLRRQQRQVAHPAHQIPAVRMRLEVISVKTTATGVCKEQRPLKGTVQIREIGGVGVTTGPLELIRRRRRISRLTRQRTCPEESQQRQQQTEDALRQTEEDPAALAGRARGSNGTDGEDLTDLPVLLDDTLTVEQSEAMGVGDRFGIEEMGKLFLGHTLPGVLDGNLHTVCKFRSGDCHPAVATGKLTGIVGHRVQHEEGEHLVGFHHCLRRFYRQVHAFHLERCTTLGEDVEEMLQTEALDMQAEVSLTQLDPVGKHIVIGIDLVGEFTDVFEPFLTPLALQTAGLVDDTVDERRNAVDE